MREGILSDEHIRKMNKAFFTQRPAKKTKYRVKNAVIPFYDLQYVAETAHTNPFAAIDFMIDQYQNAGIGLPAALPASPAAPSPTETEYNPYSPPYVPFNATPMNALPEVADQYGSNLSPEDSPESSSAATFGDTTDPEIETPPPNRPSRFELEMRRLQIDMLNWLG